MNKYIKSNFKGFTMVEIILVMAILGVLMVMAVPNLGKASESAELLSTDSMAQTVFSAASTFDAYNSSITMTTDYYTFTDDNLDDLLDPTIEIVTSAPTKSSQFMVTVYRYGSANLPSDIVESSSGSDTYVVTGIDSKGNSIKFVY